MEAGMLKSNCSGGVDRKIVLERGIGKWDLRVEE